MVVFSYTILKSDYIMAKEFCCANFEVINGNDDFTTQMIFYFANEELKEETEQVDIIDFDKVVNNFLEEQNQIKKFRQLSYDVRVSVPIRLFISILKKLNKLYPEIANSDNKVKHDFIAELGIIFVKAVKGGKLDPKLNIIDD